MEQEMDNAKHTPGPWKVRTLDCSLGSIDAAFGDVQVAQAQEVSVHDRNTGHNERKANARLIAAAPTMLEALQAYMDLEKDHHGNMLVAFRPVTDLIRAAIAKATGSAQ